MAYNKTTPQECSPLTLTHKLNSETRNQREVAWCYAFTTADMLGAHHELSEPVSAADVALRYNKTFPAKLIQFFRKLTGSYEDPIERYLPHQTGFTKIAIARMYSTGWCPESVFPSEFWTKNLRSKTGWIPTQVPLKNAFKDLLDLSNLKKDLSLDNLPFYYSFKNIETPEKFLELLKRYKYDEFIQQLRLTACKDDRREFPVSYQSKMVLKNGKVFTRLNKNLSEGRIIGLDYDSRILQQFNNYGLNLDYLHTSILIGRQWNDQRNECEYLVRDSYGTACEDYEPGARCNNGYVWLPESVIYKNMTSFVYLQTP